MRPGSRSGSGERRLAEVRTKDREDDACLAGKVAIVSGGGAAGDGIGNGRAAAILLARAGARVVVADLDPELAGRTVKMIEAEGSSAAAVACDVTVEPASLVAELDAGVLDHFCPFGRFFLDHRGL